MDAFALSKTNDEDKAVRMKAIEEATKYAIEVPLKVMRYAYQSLEIIHAMAETGNPNSVSDAGVGALCARSAVLGAYLNVRINASGLKDETYKAQVLTEAAAIRDIAIKEEEKILKIVEMKMA
jgi:glutamate formiminotransferase/formiminotetrahydrofolate cyclodeaminase